MKKLLALVLALVMTLGLATVGTSAAYSDANDIEYTEAADVMTAVGVFQGKGDAFAPKDNLNRAEAAKLVAYLMLGNKTAEAMKGSGAKFADVPASHWASGYIEYLATAGVVSGVGGGNFDPNGQVTAVQFAKMLLVALGYDAEIEGFTGNSSWAINIQKLANDNDLYDLLDDLSSTAALTREQAAQMCLNDLKADMVEYESKGTTVSVGDAKVTTDAKKATEKLEKGNNNYNNAAIGTSDRNYRQLAEELYGNDLKLTDDGKDDLGRPANKWSYKAKDVGTYAAKSDLLFSTYAKVKVNALYDVIGKDAYDNLLDGDDVLYVYTDGAVSGVAKQSNTESNIQKWFSKDSTADASNSGRGTMFELYRIEDGAGVNKDAYYIVTAKTYLVQATADYNTTNESVKVSYVTDNGSVKPTKFPDLEIEQDDFNVADVKKDDYLLVTYSSDDGSFQSVQKAETIQGKVTAYTLRDSVTIDGTKKNYSAIVSTSSTTAPLANTTHGAGVEFDLGTEIKAVLDAQGNVIYIDEADSADSYLYIKSAGANSIGTKIEAQAYFTDGTTKVISVKKATYYDGGDNTGGARTALSVNSGTTGTSDVSKLDDTGAAGPDIANQWYTYTVDESGDYTLKAVGTSTSYKNTDNTQWYALYSQNSTATDINITKKESVVFAYAQATSAGDTTPANSTVNTVKANSDTVIVLLDDDDDTTVYTGVANIPGIVAPGSKAAGHVTYAAIASYVLDKDGYVKYGFIDAKKVVSASIDDSVMSDDYALVLDAGTKKNYANNSDSSDYYYEYDLYQDGKVVEDVKVAEDGKSYMDVVNSGDLFHKVRTGSKGYITKADPIADGGDYATSGGSVSATTNANRISYSNGTVTLYTAAGSARSYVLNTNNVVLVYGGTVTAGVYDKTATSDIKKNVNDSYTVNVVNGTTLESNLNDYTYTYKWSAVLNDNGSNKIDQLYVYISKANGTGVTAGSSSSSSVAAGTYAVDLRVPGTVMFYSTVEMSNEDAANLVAEAIEDAGYVISNSAFSTDYVFTAKKPNQAINTTFTLAVGNIDTPAKGAAGTPVVFSVDGKDYGLPDNTGTHTYAQFVATYLGASNSISDTRANQAISYRAKNETASQLKYGALNATGATNDITGVTISSGDVIELGYIEVQDNGGVPTGNSVVDTSKLIYDSVSTNKAYYAKLTATYESMRPAAATTGTGIEVNTNTYLPYSTTMATVNANDGAANSVAKIKATEQIKVTVYNATLNAAGTAAASTAAVKTFAAGYGGKVNANSDGGITNSYGTYVRFSMDTASTYTAFNSPSTNNATTDVDVYVGYVGITTTNMGDKTDFGTNDHTLTWSPAQATYGTCVAVGTKITATLNVNSTGIGSSKTLTATTGGAAGSTIVITQTGLKKADDSTAAVGSGTDYTITNAAAGSDSTFVVAAATADVKSGTITFVFTAGTADIAPNITET